MNHDREAKVRARAYERWEQSGRPEGRDLENWLEAERELDAAGDDESRGAISNRPPGEEWSTQRDLPPRGTRKGSEEERAPLGPR